MTTIFTSMDSVLQRELKQAKPFSSREHEALLGLQVAAQRAIEPWAQYLKSHNLTLAQYNVLRILRGAHPEGLTSGGVAERSISRDPDVTRMIDRLEKRGLVRRQRSAGDRRVVKVLISDSGLDRLAELDAPAEEMPKKVLGSLGKRRLEELNELLGAVISELGAHPERTRRTGGG
jgi:DNA-binding MarR family transcriptional regulator